METEEERWEFDDRRFDICEKYLQAGEELVWDELDDRFNCYDEFGRPAKVKKTLRRLEDVITFIVQNSKTDGVFTVGTIYIGFTAALLRANLAKKRAE
jgi:hypothetical protein